MSATRNSLTEARDDLKRHMDSIVNDKWQLVAQLKTTATELEAAWAHLSGAPNAHVEASRNLIARMEGDLP